MSTSIGRRYRALRSHHVDWLTAVMIAVITELLNGPVPPWGGGMLVLNIEFEVPPDSSWPEDKWPAS